MPRDARDLAGSLRSIPAAVWTLAVSLNGFFLYLGVLDIVGVEPRTSLTVGYYAALGALMLWLAWRARAVLVARLRAPGRTVIVYVAAGVLLATWFLLNVALFSDGTLPKRLAALLILWTLPSALLFASLARADLERLAGAVTALGLVFVAAEALALARLAGDEVRRFSPVAALDAISAAQVPALGAVACLALRPVTRRGRLTQGVALTLLVAGAVVPGSRGPLLALVVASAAVAVLAWRTRLRLLVPCLVLGLAGGWALASAVGTTYYLTYSTPGFGAYGGPGGPISTLSIRRQWWRDAIESFPDEPLTGHGVAMFVDDTPEARRMGVAGRRTYPHNSLVEAGYSLGLLGLLPFVLIVAIPCWAFVRMRAGPARNPDALFLLSLFLFAFVASNLSGEIGADALLWSSGALAVGLYGAERAAAVASSR